MKLELNNGKWQVVKNGEVVAVFDSIRDANDYKFEHTSRKPRAVIAFKADGTEITKTIRRVA